MDEQVVPVLRVENAEDAVAWSGRLGFTKDWEHRFEPGFPLFVSISRGPMQIFLSEHTGDARPDTLVHLYVHDLDRVVEEFGVSAEHLPWGRQVELRDVDGNRWRIGQTQG